MASPFPENQAESERVQCARLLNESSGDATCCARKALRWSFGLMLACILGGLVMVGASGQRLWLTLFCISPVALVSLISAFVAMARAHRTGSGSLRCATALWAAIALSLCVGYAMLCVHLVEAERGNAKTLVSCGHLRAIATAVAAYTSAHSELPCALHDLIGTYLPDERALRVPADPDAFPERPAYSSYEYKPGSGAAVRDPKLLIAFERGSWTLGEVRVFRRPGRWVLFGDGRVEILDAAAFERATQEDARRRAELGWPTTQSHGDSFPASAPTTLPSRQTRNIPQSMRQRADR